MKKLKDKRGVWPLGFLIPYVITMSIIALGTVKTTLDGTLVNNTKVIACKAANKGENFCNDKYGYTPKIVKETKSGGGLRTRILAHQG